MREANSELEAKEADDLLQPAGKQPSASIEHDDFSADRQSSEQALYDATLQRSMNKVKLVMLVSLIAPLMCTTRFYVTESYMASLSPSATASFISIIIFVKFALSALESFTATWLGDRYSHDKSLLFAFTMNAIGVLLESISVHGQLWLFVTGFMLAGFAMVPIAMSYIAYVLPHKHAISYMSLYYTMGCIVYLLGPFVAALIAQYTSYRNVFWFNAYVFAGCIVTILVFIVGSQKKLQSEQLTLSEHYVQQQHADDIFPVCNQVQNNDDSGSSTSWSTFFREIGRIELILLTISIVSNCMSWTSETIHLFYFAMFFMGRYDVSLMYTTAMFLLLTTCFGVSTLCIPKIVQRIIPKHVYIVTASSVIFAVTQILVAYVFTPSGSSVDIVWLWLIIPVWGSAFGATHISTEMCILEVQPKQHSGKVSAAKEAVKILCTAFGVLLVGQFWSAPLFNSFCVVNAMCALIAGVLSFFVWYFGNRLPN